jgi:F0F1-type ATP synthase epsilon subunit
MSGSLKLTAWTPSESLITADSVAWVHVELVQSRPLTIWPGHARLLAEMTAGTLRYADSAGIHEVDLPAGILEVQDDEVLVLLAGALSEGREAEDTARFDRLADTLLEDRRGEVPAEKEQPVAQR